MRDPGLVLRAERAATALERAWEHWRGQHGLGGQPPAPVSSYVGYSLEEPWGQPRVVFGVAAEDAELLAALLDGHDCVGPVYAEVYAEVADWRRTNGSHLAATALPADSRIAVPAQAPPPPEPARSPAEATVHQAVDQEPGSGDTESAPPGPADQRPSPLDADAQSPAERAQADREALVLEADPVDAVPLEELAPLPPNEISTGVFETPGDKPANGGPRYQGFPPQYQAESTADADADAGSSGDASAGAAGDESGRAVPQMVAKLSRSRRSQRGGQRGTHDAGTWPHGTEHPQAAADSAV